MKHAGLYRWTVSLDVDCPHCVYCFDANEEPDFFEQMRNVEIFEAIKGVQVHCPKCKETFLFDIGAGT
jgi:phage FluMu protein Com